MRRLCLFALLVVVGACAPKTIPLPAVSAPKYPEFIQPVAPPELAGSPAVFEQERGWVYLQAGDLKNAEREFGLALNRAPAFYPAEASLGYVELARKDPKAALPHFDHVLASDPRYAPALVGRGQALLALDREADALGAFETAAAVDPSLTDITRRVEVLKFRGLEQDLAAGRQAARSGRLDEAARAYARAIASSPDSAFLYRELAAIERRKGENDAALTDFRQAVALEPSDASSLVQIGDILGARGDTDGAAKAYSDALALEPNADVQAKLAGVRARVELARLPDEYRAIETAPQITRADLAALIGVRLAPLLERARRRDGVVVTDVRNHWAATWIMAVAYAGVIEPFANHTFQPRAVVRRADLAQALGRLLARIVSTNAAQAPAWQSARLKFSDLSPGHLAYPAASMAVAAGVMTVGADNSFQPSTAVTGAEAMEAIGRVAALAGLTAASDTGQR